MSGASNLGYANDPIFSNSRFVNGDNSHYAGNFTSTVVSGTPPGPLPGLAGTKFNVDAAAARYPGTGGGKLRRQIKNITKYYKRMRAGSRRIRRMKSMLRRRAKTHHRRRSSSHHHKKRSHRRYQRGGYAQYQNNQPLSASYQVAGIHLPPALSALASPAPITAIGGNCVDNYNHYTNMGFASPGH